MNISNIVVNTLVYLESMKEGVLQADLLERLNTLGIKKVEVRREFFKKLAEELPQIAKVAEKNGQDIFYSVPLCLYEDGKLVPKRLEKVFSEAKEMGCRNVKLNIGDYAAVTSADMEMINDLCENCKIALTIENDQTQENGRCEKTKLFLEAVCLRGGSIGLTFDIGNWLYTGEEPYIAAKALRQYVTYIHLKDVSSGTPATTPLGEGSINWQRILHELPQGLPVALEYPCEAFLPQELEKLLAAEY